MGKRNLVLLLTLFMFEQGCDSFEGMHEPNSFKDGGEKEENLTDEGTKQNPLQKGLLEIIRGSKESEGVVLEKGKEYIRKRVEEVYAKMNSALARKDLPQFMEAYREAIDFKNQLSGIGFVYSKNYWSEMFGDLNRNYFGNIATKILANPTILENWPHDCIGLDQDAKELAQELYRFNRNKRIDQGDIIDDKNGEALLVFHDDDALAIAVNKNMHAETVLEGQATYFVEGIYADMRFSTPANLLIYTLFTAMHNPESPLESTVKRCGFIDLGMDGIDTCDARLNNIPDNDAAIRTANEKARNCMAETSKKLRQRYAGTSYFRK